MASCRGNNSLYSDEIAEETVTIDLHNMFWDICKYQSSSLMSVCHFILMLRVFSFTFKIFYSLLTAIFPERKKNISIYGPQKVFDNIFIIQP